MASKDLVKLSQKRILNISIPQRVIGEKYKLLDFFKTYYYDKSNSKRVSYYSIKYRVIKSGVEVVRFTSSFDKKSFLDLLSDAEKIRLAFVKKVGVKKNEMQEL